MLRIARKRRSRARSDAPATSHDAPARSPTGPAPVPDVATAFSSPVAAPPAKKPVPFWRNFFRLGVAGLIPPFLLAFASLTQPWAKARIVVFWGLSRSPEAVVILIAGLAAALAAGVAVAWSGRKPALSAAVHLAFGLLLAAIAGQAYEMVRDAGVRALGFVPIASVRPGRGLFAFAAAALGLMLLAILEFAVAARRGTLFGTRRRRGARS